MVFVEILKRFLGTTVLWFSYYQTIYTCDFDYKLRVDLTVQILLQVLLLLHLLKQDNFIIGMKYEPFLSATCIGNTAGQNNFIDLYEGKRISAMIATSSMSLDQHIAMQKISPLLGTFKYHWKSSSKATFLSIEEPQGSIETYLVR